MLRAASLFAAVFLALAPARDRGTLSREADFYHKLAKNIVACDLCPRRCVIPPGGRGTCRVRENRGGTLYSVVYGKPCSVGKEPIEKSPFFHFLPGSLRLTLATVGCNQSCKYCQNWEISQAKPEDVPARDLSPEAAVALAQQEKVPVICLTYSEPIVFYEYVADIARLARSRGLKTAVVTGGYINPEPMRKLCGLVDAVKIDLKGFTPEFYRNVCGSTLEPVLEACRIAASSRVHLELVNLVVPSLNDDTAGLRAMCRWIRENCGDTVPVHFTRFHPQYRLQNSPPTPVSTLEAATRIARSEGLKYVYVGNVPGHREESTVCPECGRIVINRRGFTVLANNLENGKCRFCRAAIAGVWR